MTRFDVSIRSLIVATDLDSLPDSSIIEGRGDYVVVRSPSNPTHFWGNFLLWRRPPEAGDRERWERAFDAEFGPGLSSSHRAFSWDVANGERGAADAEFLAAGYEASLEVGLVATPQELVAHPRTNREVQVRQLDVDGDERLWAAAEELQVANRGEGHGEDEHRAFVRRRMRDRRELFAQGRGAWFLALTDTGVPAASCGVLVTDGRGRFQAVDTLEQFRRRGIATGLVHDAGRAAIEQFGARRLVIVADEGYHAAALYRSLGFVERERGFSVCWWSGAPNATAHPTRGRLARRDAEA